MEQLIGAHEGKGEGEGHDSPKERIVCLPAIGEATAGQLPSDLIPGPYVLVIQSLVVHPNLGDRFLLTGLIYHYAARRVAVLDHEKDFPSPRLLVRPGVGVVRRVVL